jgi:hypothetical protein
MHHAQLAQNLLQHLKLMTRVTCMKNVAAAAAAAAAHHLVAFYTYMLLCS